MSIGGELVDIVREIVKDEINQKDASTLCTVKSVNEDQTLNISLPSDDSTIISNIYNCSSYTFKSGDVAVLYKIGNKLNNAFVIAKPTTEIPARSAGNNFFLNGGANGSAGSGTIVTTGVTSINGMKGDISLGGGLSRIVGANGFQSNQPISMRSPESGTSSDMGSRIYIFDTDYTS